MEPPITDKTEEDFRGVGKASSISLALDDYEDIFSDFDPRPYSERMLSDDFLYELKRASLDKEESGLTLSLLMPKEKRNSGHEKVILERLKGHFRRHHRRLEDKRKGEIKTGTWMVALGITFMFLATYILFRYEKSLWTAFVVVLLWVMQCTNLLMRKQFTENEKLGYPLVKMPLELTSTQPGAAFPRSPRFSAWPTASTAAMRASSRRWTSSSTARW